MDEETLKEINRKLDLIISLLDKEETLSGLEKTRKKQVRNSYKGIKGGLRLLVEQEFFSTKRKFSEIMEELKTKTYNYPRTSVQPTLIDMSKPGGLLVRIKEGKIYYYVLRK